MKHDDAGKPVTEWKPHLMFMGLADDGFVSGARLIRVLCGDFKTWAFPVGPNAVTDITDEFWSMYERDGRCAVDRSHRMHFRNAEDRFTEVGATRRCNWCGEWHYKTITMRVNVERVEEWEAA